MSCSLEGRTPFQLREVYIVLVREEKKIVRYADLHHCEHIGDDRRPINTSSPVAPSDEVFIGRRLADSALLLLQRSSSPRPLYPGLLLCSSQPNVC